MKDLKYKMCWLEISHLEDDTNEKIEDCKNLDYKIEVKKAYADYIEDKLSKVFQKDKKWKKCAKEIAWEF